MDISTPIPGTPIDPRLSLGLPLATSTFKAVGTETYAYGVEFTRAHYADALVEWIQAFGGEAAPIEIDGAIAVRVQTEMNGLGERIAHPGDWVTAWPKGTPDSGYGIFVETAEELALGYEKVEEPTTPAEPSGSDPTVSPSPQPFRKRAVVIEAMQFNGFDDYLAIVAAAKLRGVEAEKVFGYFAPNMTIETLEGVMTAVPGDWILQGVQGEYYPCKPDIFAATYDLVEPIGGPVEGLIGTPEVEDPGEPQTSMPMISPRFAYRRPSPEGIRRMTEIRAAFTTLERAIERIIPDCRQRAVAFTVLEEASYRANRAVVETDPGATIPEEGFVLDHAQDAVRPVGL